MDGADKIWIENVVGRMDVSEKMAEALSNQGNMRKTVPRTLSYLGTFSYLALIIPDILNFPQCTERSGMRE